MSVLSCSDFPDEQCCSSCHDDAEYSDTYPLLEVYGEKELFARVCCAKYDAAAERMEKENGS